MDSVTTERFRKAFEKLPDRIKDKARKNYELWKHEPFHPALSFKQIIPDPPIFSVRIGLSYRALGVKEENCLIWFWIGSHEDYNTLIREL